MISIKFLKKNKKQTITMVMGIILSSVLLFSIGILFSSFRNFMIEDVKKNVGNYHVKIVGNINDVDKKQILSIKKKNEYYIRFKNIKNVYSYTENICEKNQCLEVIYNTKLLSLYGVTDNDNLLSIFKKIITLIVLILSLAVFFIVYNSFNISLVKQKRDIFLLKVSGADNRCLYKIYFFQGIIVGLIGIIIGFLVSMVMNIFSIKFINLFLYEFFRGSLKLSIYFDFILIPFFFIILIVFLSSLFPLRNLNKYKIVDLYNPIKNNYINKYDFRKNFVFNYSLINYEREKHNYRNLIICLFILLFLFNSFFSFMRYTFKIINDYVILPEYDLLVKADIDVVKDIDRKLVPSKSIIYNSCNGKVQIAKDKFNKNQEVSNALITNLGGNELINFVFEVKSENDLMVKNNYIPFNKLDKIILNDEKLSISLTNKIPFGFKSLLKSDIVILNLDNNNFSKFCLNYDTIGYFKTDKSNLDVFLNNYAIKNNVDLIYSNVKKAKQIISNIVLLIKVFIYLIIVLIILICVTTIFNIVSANIKFRKRELANLKSLGFLNVNIVELLCLECFIITFKAFIYALPFILLVFKFFYNNLGKVFKLNLSNFDYKLLTVSFVLCLIIVIICMLLSYMSLMKESLIINIKQEIF